MGQSGELLPKPPLGHRLTDKGYQELPPSGLADGREAFYSAALRLLLRSRGHGLGLELVFRDPQSGEDIPVGEEMDRAFQSERSARLAAEGAAQSERSARLAAEEAVEAERSARLAAEGETEAKARAAESERCVRVATEERLAGAEEALRRALASTVSDLD